MLEKAVYERNSREAGNEYGSQAPTTTHLGRLSDNWLGSTALWCGLVEGVVSSTAGAMWTDGLVVDHSRGEPGSV